MFVFKHAKAILTFVWLTAVLLRSNDFLRAQVALRSERATRYATSLLVVIACQIFITYKLFPSDPFWCRLFLLPRPTTPLFLDAVWEAGGRWSTHFFTHVSVRRNSVQLHLPFVDVIVSRLTVNRKVY